MKTLNGYEIVDAAARERISTLEKLVEGLLGQSGGGSFTPVTLTGGTLTDVQSGATQVKVSGTTLGYMSGGEINLVFINTNNEIIGKHELAYGNDMEEFNVEGSFAVPSDAVKCGICSFCSVGDSYVEDEYIQCELTFEFSKSDGESVSETWKINSFYSLPIGTHNIKFSFTINSEVISCTAITKKAIGDNYEVSYVGYYDTIYDSGLGDFINSHVGDVITFDANEDISSELEEWLKNDCTKV